MIDDFLTSPDDLPPVRPRPASRVVPDGEGDTARAQAPGTPASNVSRAALAAGVLLAATVVGNPPATETSSASRSGAAESRTS